MLILQADSSEITKVNKCVAHLVIYQLYNPLLLINQLNIHTLFLVSHLRSILYVFSANIIYYTKENVKTIYNYK